MRRVGLTRRRLASDVTRIASPIVLVLWAALSCYATDDPLGTRAFALLCAKHGVPVGIVAPPTPIAWPPLASSAAPQFLHDAPYSAGLAETLAEFNRRNSFCRATQVGRVVHLRATDEPPVVTSALAAVATFDSDAQGPAHSFLALAATAIHGGESQGYIGSGPMPSGDSALAKRVLLPKGTYSAVGLLDEVVRQAPGLIWFISYYAPDAEPHLWVGLMDSRGGSVRMSLDDW